MKVTDETKPPQYRLKIPQQIIKTNYKKDFLNKKIKHRTNIIVNSDYETELNMKGPHTFTTSYDVTTKLFSENF